MGRLTNPTACAGKVGLVEDNGRYFSQSTGLTLVDLFNSEIPEQHAGRARAGVNFNTSRYRSPMTCLIVSRQSTLAGTGQVSLQQPKFKRSTVHKPISFKETGFLTIIIHRPGSDIAKILSITDYEFPQPPSQKIQVTHYNPQIVSIV